jgi:hypothetical protein
MALVSSMVLVTHRAQANGWFMPFPGTASNVEPHTRTPLEVLSEKLVLHCQEVRDSISCDFTATYVIANPTTQRESVIGMFYGLDFRDVSYSVDGVPSDSTISLQSREMLTNATVTALCRHPIRRAGPCAKDTVWPRDMLDAWSQKGSVFSVEPNQTRNLVIRGTITAREYWESYSLFDPALRVRHPVLGTTRKELTYYVQYWLFPIRSWAGKPVVDVEVQLPANWKSHLWAPRRFTPETDGWRTNPKYANSPLYGQPDWRWSEEGDYVIARQSFAAGELPPILYLDVTRTHPVRNGGPLLGFGWTSGNSGGWRIRAGYELSLGSALLAGVVLDTNLHETLVAAPTIVAATSSPSWMVRSRCGWECLIPSLGVGTGFPVQLRPERQVGWRVQLDLHWPFIGVVGAFDWFPQPAGERAEHTRWTLLAQATL